MVFFTVFDALNTKLTAFASSRNIRPNIDGCSMINKSLCVPPKHKFNEKFDIRLYRAEVTITGSPVDLQELLCSVRKEGGQVRSRIQRCNHENNLIMVYFTNTKSAEATLSLKEFTLRALCGHVQKIDSG